MQPTQKPPIEPATRLETEDAATDPVTTPATTLRSAALYLERHGWTQGLFFDLGHDGPFPPACAMGAIRMAVCGSTTVAIDAIEPDQPALITRTNRCLAGYLDPVWSVTEDDDPYSASDRIGDWNDEPDRTPADVITAMRAAADDWDRIHPNHTNDANDARALATTGGASR